MQNIAKFMRRTKNIKPYCDSKSGFVRSVTTGGAEAALRIKKNHTIHKVCGPFRHTKFPARIYVYFCEEIKEEEKVADETGEKKKLAQRYCNKCKTGKISSWNKSGLCRKCGMIAANLKVSNKRKEKNRDEKPEDTTKKTEKSQKSKTSRIIDENKERLKKIEGRPDKGTCVRCEEKFKLKDWQDESIHWCPNCRKIPGHKGPLEGLY